MLHLKANEIKFTFPQYWGEVTLKQWRSIQQNPEDLQHIASVLSGLNVDQSILSQLMPFMSFMEAPFDANDWKIPEAITLGEKTVKVDVNIWNETWGQKILMHTIVKPEEVDKAIALYLQPRYTGNKFDYKEAMDMLPVINNLKLSEVYPVANFFFKQVHDAIEKEKKELATKPTSEQVRAGINMFDQFGINNTIDSMAHGDALKYEQVLKLQYSVVFLKLKRTKVETKFKNNYQKIMNEKANKPK